MVSKAGFGILQLTVKVDTIKDEDDFENRIALNTYEDTSTITPTEEVIEEGDIIQGNGGRIW